MMDDDDEEAQEQRRQEKAARKLPQHKYKHMMQQLADRKIDEVLVDLDDVSQYEADVGAELKLVQSIEVNTKHYVEILSRAIDDCMPEPSEEIKYVQYVYPIKTISTDYITASRTTFWTS